MGEGVTRGVRDSGKAKGVCTAGNWKPVQLKPHPMVPGISGSLAHTPTAASIVFAHMLLQRSA